MGFLWLKGKSNKALLLVAVSFLLVFNGKNTLIAPADAKSRLHIVYLGEKQHEDPELLTTSHHEMLASVVGSKEAAIDSMVYSYRHGFSGFAAKLTESQAKKISEFSGVVHVTPNSFYSPQTTRSWDYLGLSSHSPTNLMHETNMGDGIVIGIMDFGIWPESKMLNDDGVGPIPTRWKGRCESGESFNATTHCNRKLIGAKWFIDGFLADNEQPFNTVFWEFYSPRDGAGHGTHTATTAAGSFVANASGAPRAHLAVYKTCWNVLNFVCAAADLLKAFDEAIYDGVDVLSLSIGNYNPKFAEVDKRDAIATGSFHAVAKSITVVCAADNTGPAPQTVSNVAPWIITMAATTIDRSFPTPITLGNNKTLLGQAMFVGKEVGFTGLVYPKGPEQFPTTYGVCESLTLNTTHVAGNVVICFTTMPGPAQVTSVVSAVRSAGGVGVIIARNPSNLFGPCSNDFPCIVVDYKLGTEIMLYIRSTRSPTVKLSPSKTLTGKPISTKVAYFSSRGPNAIAPAILKPDIAAPGVNILAASSYDPAMDGRFALLSGTSMATPHIAGIVAILKSSHPGWSPAAMKSALVITAWKTDPFGEPIFAEGTGQKFADPFDYGGGLVNPNKEANPGLIYDMGTNDYINYLCAFGYNTSAISLLVKQATSCPVIKPSILDVNLPSITIPNLRSPVTLTRTVTNVGPVISTYKAQIEPPPGINVVVKPEALVFNSTVKALSFTVAVSTTYQVNMAYFFGSLTWTDGVHAVSSPISLHIVYLGEKQHRDPELLTISHHEMLASVVGSKEAAIDSMVYSYRQGFSGFATKLTESQARRISVRVIIGRNPSNLLGACSNDFPCIVVDNELGTELFYKVTQA
ncbi:subtilisin-like protease SBT5.3 [Pyrus ussuriensis x Pyrus communis]|uniref:Subtilisin-like protease SBT5.3 n=1 Tax=Pyrus ussuriensis x Pyrus communis TaxID=2448454 RepID=A0A5N5G1G8_9ROSA|nr:subtilisin-like protease SBT5.3 [Pyrus ussuriensis x Pyrus communis]